MTATPLHPFRVYTVTIDAEPHEVEFPHPERENPAAHEIALKCRLSAWLDRWFPGCESGGRVTEVHFSDHLRPACFMDWTVAPAGRPLSPAAPAVKGPPQRSSALNFLPAVGYCG
jgi:hypothetical protein